MPHQKRARLRGVLLRAALVIGSLVAASGVAAAIAAKPVATDSPVPLEAFQPVVAPALTSRPPATATAPRPLDARRPRPDVNRPPTIEPAAPAGPVHVVRPGDTLWQIAVWHRADLDLIVRWNDGIDPRHLVTGQRVLVPGGRPMPAPARASTATSGPAASSVRSASHLWPLPVRGTITTRFSAAHPGIDIAARAGTPVRAIAAGTVTWAGWKTNGGGYVVVIRHPDGMVSTYNHNRKVTVRVGEEVARGEQIAEVGSTGWSTGPHLDLRIRMNGTFINPLRLEWAR